jgi:hypothetical protein
VLKKRPTKVVGVSRPDGIDDLSDRRWRSIRSTIVRQISETVVRHEGKSEKRRAGGRYKC